MMSREESRKYRSAAHKQKINIHSGTYNHFPHNLLLKRIPCSLTGDICRLSRSRQAQPAMEPHIGLFYIFTAVYVTYTDAVVPYQENWIDQNVDHFNFYSTVYGKTTYKQKYLVQGDKLYFSWFIAHHDHAWFSQCF